MSQNIHDYHNFFYQLTSQYNQVLKSLFTIMDQSGFQLLTSPSTYPNHRFSFIFVPVNQTLNHLQEPFQHYCKFNSRLYLQIDHLLHRIQHQIVIYNLASHNQNIQFYQYIHLTKKLQRYLELQSNFKLVNFNIEKNFIEIKFSQMPIPFLLRESYIKNVYCQLKKNVIQLFIINKQYHDQLTTKEIVMFEVQHSIHQRDMYFSESQRLSKQLNLFKVKEIERKFQENMQKNGLNELLTGQTKKKVDHNYFNVLTTKSTQKKKQIKGLIQKRQKDKQYMQNQFGITIYEFTLNEKTFPTLSRDLKGGYERNKKILIKQNRSMCICQGITILHLEEETNKKLEQFKQSTFLSSVEFIQCFVRYHLSIHSCTNQFNTEFDNTQQIIEGSQNMRKNSKFLLKLDETTDFKRLAKKRCLQLGQKQFVNEYRFLKYIRHKVFPYISKYYLQEIINGATDDNKNQNDGKNQQFSNKEQTFQQITKKSIYIEEYMIHMGQFLRSNSRPIYQLQADKITHILFQLVVTLRYLSYFNILHRDIKLNNIMMDKTTKGYQVRLIDWGNCYRDTFQKPTKNNSIKPSPVPNNQPNPNPNNKKNDTSPTKAKAQIKHKPTLVTSHDYIQTYDQLKKSNKEILQIQFNNCPHKFQTNEYFDIYSYGHILGHFINQLDIMFNSNHWLISKLKYLQNKCLNLNPYHRLTPFQIMVYLHYIINLLKNKNIPIKSLKRNHQNIIQQIE